jgi:hypothetical protein
MREGSSMMREGVAKEIPDAEDQNAAMVNVYSTLEDPAPTVVNTRLYNYCTSCIFFIFISGMMKMPLWDRLRRWKTCFHRIMCVAEVKK